MIKLTVIKKLTYYLLIYLNNEQVDFQPCSLGSR